MRRQITLAEVLDAARFAENAARYSCMPGVVTGYHAPVQGQSPATVDVQPGVQDVRLDTDTGELVFEPWPVIPKVPVAFPKFGGRAVWGPLSIGDDVQLIAHDLDPSVFRATGQHAKPVLTRRNSGCHWWAYPGSIVDPNGLPDPGQAICIGTPGGVIVAVDGSFVNLGSASPSDFVALASKVDSMMSALKTHTHPVPGVTVGAGATTSSASAQLAVPGVIVPCGSAVVKCQP